MNKEELTKLATELLNGATSAEERTNIVTQYYKRLAEMEGK